MKKKTKVLLSFASAVAIIVTATIFCSQKAYASKELNCEDFYDTTCIKDDIEYCYFWRATDGSLCYVAEHKNRVPSSDIID